MAGRGRPGGNPEFGTKFKFDYGNEEKKTEALTIRITPSFLQEIKNIAGDRYRDFCREAIAERLGRELAAQTEVTKTKTTELVTEQEQQLGDSQTTQLNLELETDPTPAEQATTPKRRRKATQTPAQKPTKPRSQTRSRKSSATES